MCKFLSVSSYNLNTTQNNGKRNGILLKLKTTVQVTLLIENLKLAGTSIYKLFKTLLVITCQGNWVAISLVASISIKK